MAGLKYSTFLSQWQKGFFACMSILAFITDSVESTCSSSCSSCVNDKCEKCLKGTYLESTGDCLTCPDKCTSCYDGEYCYSCTTGFYRRKCTRPCTSNYCVNNECDIDNGHCISGCMEGYFQVGVDCHPCDSNCKTCVNFSNNCPECTTGYYGSSCQNTCSHCKDGICSNESCTYGCGDGYYQVPDTCNPCNIRCTSCSSFEDCTSCHNRYWGTHCQYTCTDCSPCNKDDGFCAITETSTTPRSSTSKTPVTDMLKTTSIIQDTSELAADALSTTSYFPQHKGSTDDNGLLYAAVIGWVLLVLLIGIDVAVIVVVYRRRTITSQGHNTSVNVLPIDSVSTSTDYTSLDMRTRRENENQYSMLQNPEPNLPTVSAHNTLVQEENTGEITLDHPTSSQHNDQYDVGQYMNT